jgi:hypothetical protein
MHILLSVNPATDIMCLLALIDRPCSPHSHNIDEAFPCLVRLDNRSFHEYHGATMIAM